jgi:hypothetical protein
MNRLPRPLGGHRGCYCACYRAYEFGRPHRKAIDPLFPMDDIRDNVLGDVRTYCRAPANRGRFCYHRVRAIAY